MSTVRAFFLPLPPTLWTGGSRWALADRAFCRRRTRRGEMVVFSRTGMGRPAGWTGTGPPLASFRFFRSTSRFYWRGGASVATAILTNRRRRSAPTTTISRRRWWWWRWCVSTVTLRTGFRLGLQHWNWTRGMGQRNGGIGIRIAIDRIGNWRRELSLKCFRSSRSLLCRSFGRGGG